MRKRILIIVTAVIAIIVAAVVFNIFFRQLFAAKLKSFKSPPPHVSSVRAIATVWRPRLDSVGSLAAINGVTVTTETSGVVMGIGFTSGSMVKKGSYLVQLDNSLDIQDLKNNQAQLTLARLDFNRKEKLFRTNAVSRSDYDDSLAKLRQAQAQVDKTRVEIAQKRIQAPFSGMLGIREVNLGQYLNPGDAIVTLQKLNPLYVNFSLPQRYLSKIHQGQKISLTSDAYPDKTFAGKVTAVNALVTSDTRNVDIQATVNNPNLVLYPGIYVNVQLHLPDQQKRITLPQTAVDYSLYGNIVYLVKRTKGEDGETTVTVEQRQVKVGTMVDDKVQILDGVAVGDEVVSDGQLKLNDNMEVIIDNTVNMKLPAPSELEGGA